MMVSLPLMLQGQSNVHNSAVFSLKTTEFARFMAILYNMCYTKTGSAGVYCMTI